MDVCEEGLGILYSFEGKHTKLPDGRYKAYLDKIAVPNIPTIYAGLTKGVHMGMIVTEEEGERMLRKELSVTEDAIETLVKVPLNQHQFSALVVLVYNIGVGAFKGSTLLKLLNQGKYEQVPAQMARWCNAGGKKINGLARRRAAEAALFMKPMPHEEAEPVDDAGVPVPMMPQRVEEVPVVSTTEVVQSSWTIRSALAALGGAIVQGYGWLTQTATEAGVEAAKVKTSIGPFDALFAALKANVGLLATIAIIAGLTVVIARRISDAKEGVR